MKKLFLFFFIVSCTTYNSNYNNSNENLNFNRDLTFSEFKQMLNKYAETGLYPNIDK